METNFYAHTVNVVVKVQDKELARTMYVKGSRLAAKQGEKKPYFEFHGDFYKDNKKVGFYRWDTHYEWPTFFPANGKKMMHSHQGVTSLTPRDYLCNAITEAIKEGCRQWWKDCTQQKAQSEQPQQEVVAAEPVKEEAAEAVAAPKEPQKEMSIEDFMFSVDINKWTKEVFLRLGMNEKTANNLVAAVQSGEVKEFEHFHNVKGVGPKTYEKLVNEFMAIAKDHAA